MKNLHFNQKISLTVIEGCSVFLTVFLNQMITTVFPAYPSVQSNLINTSFIASQVPNCTVENPSNVYVAILIGSKYCVELIMLPIIGWLADKYHPPLILFGGALVESLACIVYSCSGNFYITMVGRFIDAIGYSIVSTSGLTIIYTIYLNEQSRNKVITIDSILVYVAASTSPYVAGAIFDKSKIMGDNASRVVTFMSICPLFLILAIAIVPFAFQNSRISKLFLGSDNIDSCVKSEGNGAIDTYLEVTESFLENNKLDNISQSDIPPETNDNDSMQSHNHDEPRDTYQVEIKKSLNIPTLLKDPHIIIVLMCLLFNTLIGNSLETTLPIFMIRKFCSDPEQQGIVWLFGFLSLKGFFLSSVLYHFFPQICWILPIIGLFLSGLLCSSLSFCTPWYAIGICLGWIAFCSSLTEVILIPMIPAIIDVKYSKIYGSGSGLTLITFTISGLIGTFPVGLLVENFGFLTLCIILTILSIACAPFVSVLRPYFK